MAAKPRSALACRIWRGDGGSHICGELLSALESKPAPAGEVTADALQIACDAFDGKNGGEYGSVRKRIQAALAAAYPALVQQVERLRIDVAASHSCLNELSADNARLAKDAEMVNGAIGGKYIFFKERHGSGHQTTKALSQLIDFIAKKRDAATAQAKQGTK